MRHGRGLEKQIDGDWTGRHERHSLAQAPRASGYNSYNLNTAIFFESVMEFKHCACSVSLGWRKVTQVLLFSFRYPLKLQNPMVLRVIIEDYNKL
jgi:hypothetical protein